MTDKSNLARDYIPAIEAAHNKETSEIFKGRRMSVQVDSTYRVEECVTDDLHIMMRPKLKRVSRHLKEGNNIRELSSLVIHTVRDMVDYYRLRYEGLPGADDLAACANVLAISGDRLSVNRCAFMSHEVYLAFPQIIFIDCHPHTLANCGKILDESCTAQMQFWVWHNAVFARSEDARDLWAHYAGIELLEHNNTRWFAKRDSKTFVRNRWNQYVDFFRLPENSNCGRESSMFRMRNILLPELWNPNDLETTQANKERLFLIRLELAIVCEATIEFYKSCYNLEGKYIVNEVCKNNRLYSIDLEIFI